MTSQRGTNEYIHEMTIYRKYVSYLSTIEYSPGSSYIRKTLTHHGDIQENPDTRGQRQTLLL